MTKKKATKKVKVLPAILSDFDVTCGGKPFVQITAKFINAERRPVAFKVTRTELSLGTLIRKAANKITIKEKSSSFFALSTIRDFPEAETVQFKEMSPSIIEDRIGLIYLTKAVNIVEVKDGRASRYDFQDTTISSGKIYRYTIKTKNKTVSKLVFCSFQKRKALCIAMNRISQSWNDSTVDDAYAMKAALEYNGIPTEVMADPTVSEIKSKISSYFKDLGPNDIAIVWSASHGSTRGIYIDGPSHNLVTYDEYRSLINTVTCKKIAFIFACHSGAAISNNTKKLVLNTTLVKRSKADIVKMTKDINAAIKSAFVPAVAKKAKAAKTDNSDFSIICSCSAEELTWGNDYINPVSGVWCKGLGIECSADGTVFSETSRFADLNKNKHITVKELTDYTLAAKDEVNSTPVCYPENDSTVIAVY